MSRGLQLCVACLAAAGTALLPLTRGAEEPKELKIIARAHDRDQPFAPQNHKIGPVQFPAKQDQLVIRSAEELVAASSKAPSARDPVVQKELQTELAKFLKVEAIDWSKQMVLGLQHSIAGTGIENGLRIESLKVDGKVLVVAFKVVQLPVRAAPQRVKMLALVERFDGEVKFVRELIHTHGMKTEEPKERKIIASNGNLGRVPIDLKQVETGRVIRSAQELVAHSSQPAAANDPAVQQATTAEVARLLKVAVIDWSKHMLLAVRGRPPQGTADTIAFDTPKTEGTVLMVTWRQDGRVARLVTGVAPTGLALVERFEGAVRFAPRQTSNSIGMNLIVVPAGKFRMGSPKSETDRHDDEQQHDVEITRSFYLGQHEVTVGQFRAFVKETDYRTEAEKDGTGGCAFNGTEFVQKPEYNWRNLHFAQSDHHPVVVVSWNDAVAFCAWLSKKEGKTYRLPTEAEWEYACRAGGQTRFSSGEAESSLKAVGNIADVSLKREWAAMTWAVGWDDGHPFTAPVGQFQANAWGLHDMHGNAWEWCADWYGEDYYSKSPRQDPPGPATGRERIARGGAWSTQPRFCRSAFRDWHEPGYRSDCVGFRVVAVVSR